MVSCAGDENTTWVLISFVLVLAMFPGLALFETGLLRVQVTTSIWTQVMGGLCILGMMWWFIGYALVFSSDAAFIGTGHKYLFLNVRTDECHSIAPGVSEMAFAFYQMLIASITPLLMTGAFAERIRFKAFVVIIVLWELLVYYPLTHWVAYGWLEHMGIIDFAGGIAVHTAAGVGSLTICWWLGPRQNRVNESSNVQAAVLGCFLLWCGWFGFNAGSSFSAGALAMSTAAATMMASITAGLVWLVLSSYGKDRKPSVVAVSNGVLIGLVAVTPAAGFITMQYAVLLGFIGAVAGWLGCIFLHRVLKVDDALDVTVLHGLSGIIGTLFLGVTADSDINGIADRGGRQLGIQALGLVVGIALTVVMSLLILVLTNLCITVRATEQEQKVGLDIVDHGERCYPELPVYEAPMVMTVTSPTSQVRPQTGIIVVGTKPSQVTPVDTSDVQDASPAADARADAREGRLEASPTGGMRVLVSRAGGRPST